MTLRANRIWAGACLAAALAPGPVARAQGVQTGTVTGHVRSADGMPLPGVTVTAASPALQGGRSNVTDVNGVYSLRGLPPGTYVVSFSLANFQSASRENVAVTVGGTIELDAAMSVAARTETVTVTAETPPVVASLVTSRTLAKREVDALPVGRRPVDIAELAPGVTNLTFNAGQLSISGAFGFDNVFMTNGVDVNDNIIGSSNNLFIEDAIQETTVLTSGIPAEYGRFSGGVVNVVTRSGGNTFGGSFRQNVANPTWIGETPREKANGITHADVFSNAFEGTFGGPIVTDRLWFFTAGRYEKANTPNTFAQTGGAYTRTDTNKRGELKLTGTVAPGHTLETSYINNSTQQANTSGIPANALVDPSTLVTRQLPNHLFAVRYDGVVSSSLLATLQFSQKGQAFVNNGGTSTSITDSPFQTLGALPGVPGGLFYHAPYLDATDPEHRDNHQLTGSLSYLFPTGRFGSHDLTAGLEHFVSTGTGGNSQSSTGYVFVTDYAVQNGQPVLDASGSPVPVFIPGASQVWNFLATRGATIDIKTTSLYAQDRWIVSPRLTLTLGARLEAVRSKASGDITTIDTTSIVPRLGAAFDLQGDGKTVVQATYGHYSGKYSQTQFAANTNVGHPSEVDYVYSGPAGQGSGFAQGFDVRNYTQVVFADFPTANIRVADGIQSPLVREVTLAVGRELGHNGHAKATYVWRDTSRFVEDFIDMTTGVTNVPNVGPLSNHLLSNTSEPTRTYQALIFQAGYRVGDHTTVSGDYTLQIRDNGNFVGEAASQPGIPSVFGNYPEIFGPALDRLMPDGRLDSFQRHKLRIYTIHTQPLGRFGSLDVSPLWRVNSGQVYSLTASIAIPAVQLARNPGYPANDINPFVRETVYFGNRGENDFKGYGVIDLAATYRVPLWKSAAPWFKVEIYNALNNQKQIGWDRTVSVDRTTPNDPNGIPTGYVKGPRFGQATNDNQFPQPYPGQNGGRAFRMAFGVRF